MYEIPFTLNGKSHSQRIDEQYKRKITLTVEEPFPCTFVRQTVTRKDVIILNPLQVAVDDIKERIFQMEKFQLTNIQLRKIAMSASLLSGWTVKL